MSCSKYYLFPELFSEKIKTVVESDSFSAAVFRYDTGIEAVQITNGPVSFEVLPYQGQQIWRLSIDGENVTMKSMFDVPENTANIFDESYGAFLIHCGLTAMGNPQEDDDHPLHGELPAARYKNVHISIVDDAESSYIAISGDYYFRSSLDVGYLFTPEIRLEKGSRVLKVSATIKNLRNAVFNYMYMAHLNWRAVDGSRLSYSAPGDSAHIQVFREDYEGELSEEDLEKYNAYVDLLQKDPTIADVLDRKTQFYRPELCSCVRYRSDEEGWAHAMQIKPDGTSYYVGFETENLPNALRWFSWSDEEDSCGFALPTTGNQMGRSYAIRHGLRKQVPPLGEAVLRYWFGKLSQKETRKMEEKISHILNPDL